MNGIGEDVQDLEVVQDSLRQLVPPSDEQLLPQKHMLAVSGEIAESHWLAMAQSDEGLPTPFITVLVFWLSFLFFTFGLQSPRNSTVICILAVCAIAVAAAVFIVSDMANPFLGVIRVSISPLRAAVARIDQKLNPVIFGWAARQCPFCRILLPAGRATFITAPAPPSGPPLLVDSIWPGKHVLLFALLFVTGPDFGEYPLGGGTIDCAAFGG